MTMSLIQTITVGSGGAASIEFTGIPQDGTDLLVVYSLRCSDASVARNVYLEINGNTTAANYFSRSLEGSGSSASSTNDNAPFVGRMPGGGATSNTFGNAQVYFPNYSGSTQKSFSNDWVTENNASEAYQTLRANLFNQTGAITSIKAYPSNLTNFVQYSTASLYKITKA